MLRSNFFNVIKSTITSLLINFQLYQHLFQPMLSKSYDSRYELYVALGVSDSNQMKYQFSPKIVIDPVNCTMQIGKITKSNDLDVLNNIALAHMF